MNDKKESKYKDSLYHNAKRSTFENANFLRKNETEAEKILWNALRRKGIDGFKFRRQHPISTFVADFFCQKKKLVIELDGSIHSFPENKEMDAFRSDKLNELGIKVIRFKNSEVEKDLGSVIEKIRVMLKKI